MGGNCDLSVQCRLEPVKYFNLLWTGSRWNYTLKSQRQYLTTVIGVYILGADNRIQQQKLGGGITKPAQSSEATGDDSEGSRKYRSKGAGPVSDL